MDKIRAHVGDTLRKLRTDKNLTLRSVGEQLGYDYSYLAKVEKGKSQPSIDLLKQMAEFYNVEISYFFDNKISVPSELENIGVEWIALVNDLKEQDLTPDDVKDILDVVNKLRNK